MIDSKRSKILLLKLRFILAFLILGFALYKYIDCRKDSWKARWSRKNEIKQAKELFMKEFYENLPFKISDKEHVLGSNSAKMEVVEYISIRCPYSYKSHLESFPNLRRDFINTGRIKYTTRIVLDIPQSYALLRVFNCVKDTKKAYNFLNYSFKHKQWIQLNENEQKNALLKISMRYGITDTEFMTCFNAKENDSKLKDKEMEEVKYFTNFLATPLFIIDKEILVGYAPYKDLKKCINKQLKKITVKNNKKSRYLQYN